MIEKNSEVIQTINWAQRGRLSGDGKYLIVGYMNGTLDVNLNCDYEGTD